MDNFFYFLNAQRVSYTGNSSAGTATYTGATFADYSGVTRVTFGATSLPAFTWTGTTNTDWFTATNWSGGNVPSASSTVTIPNVTNKPIVSGSTLAQTNALTINGSSSLTISAGGKLTVNGALTNSGTIILQNSSTASSSLLTNGTITQTGTTQVQTTLPRGARYWYYGFSVNGAGLNSGIWNAADAVNTFAYKYASNAYSRFTDNTTALNANPLPGVINGYSVKLLGAGNVTLTSSGTPNNGDLSTTFPANTWNLVCNPYPSAIDMSLVYAANSANYGTTKIDPTFWVPSNATGSTVQATYNLDSGIGQNGGSKIVASQQGFWVANRSTLSSATFNLYQSARLHTTTALKSLSASSEPSDIFRMNLVGGVANDEVVLAFRDYGLADAVTQYDSEKRLASGATASNVYTIKASKNLAINVMPVVVDEYIVPLGVNIGTSAGGNYTFNPTNLSAFDANYSVVLEDKVQGIMWDLRELGAYNVTLASGTNNMRFVLHFILSGNGVVTKLPEGKDAIDNLDISIIQTGSDVVVTIPGDILPDARIEVYGIGGEILRVKRGVEKVTRIQLPETKAAYIIKVHNGNVIRSGKVIAL